MMDNSNVEFFVERDILGLEKKTPDFSEKNILRKPSETDFNDVINLPSIKRRYVSSLVDICVMFLLALILAYIYEEIGNVQGFVRGISMGFIVLIYEPLMVSIGCTFGQLITNIRVRKFYNPDKKLHFINAMMRTITKMLLGWLSFITITLNKNRKGIHDYASSSIVVSMD